MESLPSTAAQFADWLFLLPAVISKSWSKTDIRAEYIPGSGLSANQHGFSYSWGDLSQSLSRVLTTAIRCDCRNTIHS